MHSDQHYQDKGVGCMKEQLQRVSQSGKATDLVLTSSGVYKGQIERTLRRRQVQGLGRSAGVQRNKCGELRGLLKTLRQ